MRRSTLRSLALGIALLPCLSLAQDDAASKNNLVYEIFVRSFADGDNDSRHIGDFAGVTSRLDSYLNDGDPNTDSDLETGVLWLMPIFPTKSYHGYDVTDFRNVNPEYGTLGDFKTLVAEARKRGVRVILDVPFNHTSDEHPWFKAAVNDAASPFRRFYSIERDTGARSGPWHTVVSASGEKLRYLGVFSPRMPDLDFDNPAVRREVKAIARFWLELGAAGFRLDAAKHMYGEHLDPLTEEDILRNNKWWREFSHDMYRTFPGAMLIGEVLGAPEVLRRHAWGLDALLDEPQMNDIRSQIGSPRSGLVGRHKLFVEQARLLNRTAHRASLPFPDRPFESLPFLASHDRNPRLASDLEAMKSRGMPPSIDEAYRLAVYMLLAMSSHPILYAGDEVMQKGWKWNGNPSTDATAPGDGSGIFDETLREPFPWYRSGRGPGQTAWFQPRFDAPDDGVSREEQAAPGGMLDLVRGLTNFRTRHPAFANGDIGAIASDSPEWLVFERTAGPARYLVLINQTATGRDYRFHAAWFPEYAGAELLFWSDGAQRRWKDATADGQRIGGSVFVPAYGLVVIRRRSP